MKPKRFREGVDFFVEMPERFDDDELQRLDAEARSKLIALLEAGADPQQDAEYLQMEERVNRRKRELGLFSE